MVKGLDDKIFDWFVYLVLGLISLAMIFPLMYVISMSVTPITDILKNGGYAIIPKTIDFTAYKTLLSDGLMPKAFKVTFLITVLGTLINLILSILMAYPLSKKDLRYRKIFMFYIIFTMLFSGGLIPTYLVVKSVGLIDTIWAMIIPSAIWTYNVIILKGFFEGIPEEMFEAARIDGASHFTILRVIVLPLSVPVMVTVGLFYGVGHWNEFWSATLYVGNKNLQPLQVVVRSLLMQADVLENVEIKTPPETLKMAAVIYACLPIIIVYPFLQKFFIKGMMLGAVKG